MTREEFLQGLKEALDGNMDASAIQENLNYYNEYINEEVRKGKTEQQVVDTLGDSWAIAQTLLEADENGADGGAAAGSSYGTYMKEEEGRVFEIPWWKKALFINLKITHGGGWVLSVRLSHKKEKKNTCQFMYR